MQACLSWLADPADRRLVLAKLPETMMDACVASELPACKGDHKTACIWPGLPAVLDVCLYYCRSHTVCILLRALQDG